MRVRKAIATRELMEEERKKREGFVEKRTPVFYATKDEEIFIQGVMDMLLEKAFLQINNYEDFIKDISTQEMYMKSKQDQRAKVANFFAVRNAIAGYSPSLTQH